MIEEGPFGKILSIFIVSAASPCAADVLKADVTAPLDQVDQPDVPVEIVLSHNVFYCFWCKGDVFHCQISAVNYIFAREYQIFIFPDCLSLAMEMCSFAAKSYVWKQY